ncbi:MAG: hypothetical protein EPO57_08460 [Chitinophagaceae bacterium]|nr:MAG: hypothetical protein EPO57_08460 [Chitinophagaceae bacterium]
MKLKSYFIGLIFCLTGCSENPKQSFYNLVNQNFLNFVDTTAYKTGRLIQIPNELINNLNLDKVCILVDAAFTSSKELNKSVLTMVCQENLKEFEDLVLSGKELNFDTIDISRINKKGKYALVNSRLAKEISCSAIAGKITFYKPYIAQSKAIIIFSISESSKSGYTNCWLFKKYNGNWENIKTIEIERW